MQLIDEEDDLTVALGHLIDHALEPLLELTAELRTCNEGAHIQGQKSLGLQGLRDIALDDTLGKALNDGGLTDTGLTD